MRLSEYEVRRRTVLDRILKLLSGVPWVEGGTFSWLVGPNNEFLSLDLFFPDLPLAVDVYDEYHRPWEQVKSCIEKPIWEYLRAQEAVKVNVLNKLKIPYLQVYWDDPISESWLQMRLDQILRRNRSVSSG